MKEDIEKITVKVTNTLTGEIIEKEIGTAWDAKALYQELNASESATKKAKKQIATYLDNFLGSDNEYTFVDGARLRRNQRQTTLWTAEGLKKVGLDDDAIAEISVVAMPMAKAVIDEMIERGDIKPDSKKVLNDMAIVTASKPFVEIR